MTHFQLGYFKIKNFLISKDQIFQFEVIIRSFRLEILFHFMLCFGVNHCNFHYIYHSCIIFAKWNACINHTFFSGWDVSCVGVFAAVYFSLVAAMVWFVILTYTWHMSFQAPHRMQDTIVKKAAYFHLMAWCIPLVLTVAIMALSEIDGNSITGICFVGYFNHSVRVAFLLVPLILAMLFGGFFLLRGTYFNIEHLI